MSFSKTIAHLGCPTFSLCTRTLHSKMLSYSSLASDHQSIACLFHALPLCPAAKHQTENKWLMINMWGLTKKSFTWDISRIKHLAQNKHSLQISCCSCPSFPTSRHLEFKRLVCFTRWNVKGFRKCNERAEGSQTNAGAKEPWVSWLALSEMSVSESLPSDSLELLLHSRRNARSQHWVCEQWQFITRRRRACFPPEASST